VRSLGRLVPTCTEVFHFDMQRMCSTSQTQLQRDLVDLRSDTITKPSLGMRNAMAQAEVGDDVFRDDPTVLALEARMAALAGKEAALFVASGTMGNLICVMAHCQDRSSELLVGDKAHISVYEQGGVAQLGGVHPRTLTNRSDGTFCLQELEDKVRDNDQHLPVTSLVAIENSHNKCGGAALPLDWLAELGRTCRRLQLPLHCDGARIFNSAVSQGKTIAELLEDCDSASICLSKGLGCPVGSVIVGSKQLMDRAFRLRKVLGGGMRQVGVLAAAGLYALDHQISRLSEDHRLAQILANVITRIGDNRLLVRSTDTNIVLVWVQPQLCSPSVVVRELAKEGILSLQIGKTEFRLTLHCDVTPAQVEVAAKGLALVLERILAGDCQ